MESAIYTAYQTDNQLLKEEIENYIDLIGRAQQPDGYLSTKQIIGERSGNGVSRMGDINDFGQLSCNCSQNSRLSGASV